MTNSPTTAQPSIPPHAVRVAVDRMSAAIAEVAEAAVWGLADPEVLEVLTAVEQLNRRLAGLRLSLVAEADARGVCTRDGAVDTAGWLRQRLGMRAGQARDLVRLARDKATAGPLCDVAAALADGRIGVEQAAVTVRALDRLPATVDDEQRERAARFLLGQAAVLDPGELTRVGRYLGQVLAPVEAEQAAEVALAARRLVLLDSGGATVLLHGELDRLGAECLMTALDALMPPPPTPGPAAAGEPSDDVRWSAPRRRADALVALAERALRAGELPAAGGVRPTVVVTTDLADLRADLVAAGVLADPSTGEETSASRDLPSEPPGDGPGVAPQQPGGQPGGRPRVPSARWTGPVDGATARALACDALIIPAVLGSAGQVLDLGRGSRTVSTAQRRALELRDQGCVFPGCDRASAWTDAHHGRHWADGGCTDLDNLALFCSRHHHGAMHHGWRLQVDPDDRLPSVVPPRWVDPERAPRRHHRFPPPPARAGGAT